MNILFVSKYNNIRSKLAEAYFNKYNKLKQLHAQSAGLFRGHPTPASVMEVAREHKLSLKTSQSAISTYMLEKHDLVILVADDVPTSVFRKNNPFVSAFVLWKLPLLASEEKIDIERTMQDISHRVKKLLQELGQETKTMATIDRVLFDLRRLHDPQMVKLWKRMGHPVKNFFGVDPENLAHIAERYQGDRTLAAGLWKTNIHDARVLAAMIENPLDVTEHQVETWLRQADYWDITDKIATEILANTDYGASKIKTWVRENNPLFRRTGWVLLERLSHGDSVLLDRDYDRLLDVIQKTIHREENWVQEAMLYALAGVGKRNPKLHAKALKIARRVEDVVIDYGDPAVVGPNPLERLEKVFFEEE